jgi:plasmid stabilization system protein ParE
VKVTFLKVAEAEFDDAVVYYETEQPGLGARFRLEVSRSLKRIIDFPSSYQSFGARTRRCLIARFPYGIIYKYDPESAEILVVAVAHLHRRPKYWVGRES